MEAHHEMFWGLGRTWTAALSVILLVTVILLVGRITADTWKELLIMAFGAGAAKSTAVGVAHKIAQAKTSNGKVSQ